MSYERWGKELGIVHTSLFRFVKGEVALSSRSVRILAADAAQDDNAEILSLLAQYALGLDSIKVNINKWEAKE